MENVDRLLEPDEEDDTVLESGMYPNLTDTESDGWQRFPVVRVESALNSPELESCHLPCISGEPSQILSGRPEPDYGFLSHVLVYKYRHLWSIGGTMETVL